MPLIVASAMSDPVMCAGGLGGWSSDGCTTKEELIIIIVVSTSAAVLSVLCGLLVCVIGMCYVGRQVWGWD